MGRFFFAGLILSLLVSVNMPAFATIQDDMHAQLPIGQVLGNALGSNPTPAQIKDAVAEIIRDGAETSKVVNIALSSSLDAESVIAGAIAGGGNLAAIFRAAKALGFSDDFISRIAKKAGVPDDQIASAEATATATEDYYTYEAGGKMGDNFGGSGIPAGGAGGGGGGPVSPNK